MDELGATAHLRQNPSDFAASAWAEFVETTDAIIIPSDGHALFNGVLRCYFATTPPFSSKGRNKSEFPDAIALLSLEAWATARNTKVLLVSTDGGWHDFAAESTNLVCVGDIPDAVGPFNRQVRFIAERIVAMLIENKAPEFDYEIASAVERFFDDDSMDTEASTDTYDYEAKLKGGALQSCTLSAGPSVLKSDDTNITFVVDLECRVSFDAEFTWFVQIGNEWQSVGSTDVTKEDDHILQMTITCASTIRDQPEVVEAEVTTRRVRVDFGYVEPGWDYEE